MLRVVLIKKFLKRKEIRSLGKCLLNNRSEFCCEEAFSGRVNWRQSII